MSLDAIDAPQATSSQRSHPLPGLLRSSDVYHPSLPHATCRDKDGRFSLNDILDMLELGRTRARLHQVQPCTCLLNMQSCIGRCATQEANTCPGAKISRLAKGAQTVVLAPMLSFCCTRRTNSVHSWQATAHSSCGGS